MPLVHAIASSIATDSPAAVPLLLLGGVLLPLLLNRLVLHPLAHIPGPFLARITSLFLYVVCYLGIEGRVLAYYHRKYNTPVLRVAPNSVSIADGAALHPIYVANGSFPKDSRYRNFRIQGHDTIFSALDPAYRDARAKAVLPLFAPGRLRAASEKGGVLQQCVDRFIERFQQENAQALQRSPRGRVDILDLCSRLSIDVVNGYLFQRVYGGLDEGSSWKETKTTKKQPSKPSKLSAAPFVLAIVALSRYSLLPHWQFSLLFSALTRLFPDRERDASLARVADFARRVVEEDGDPGKDDTYQSRLLAAGVSRDEAIIQCEAVMFAGADSTGLKLATILFHLVQNPDVVAALREEQRTLGQDPKTDPQTLPYLRVVIREGLRLDVANPTRLTRVVPPGEGLNVGGIHLPPGTTVGAAAYVLHHNPDIFPDPFSFRPERWLQPPQQQQLHRRDRDTFPFGLGSRMCLGRNLAMQQLFLAVHAVVASGVLDSARTCKPRIEMYEWFNAEIKGHELEIEWPST